MRSSGRAKTATSRTTRPVDAGHLTLFAPVGRVLQRWTHFRIAGDSMRPSLEPGDRVLVDRSAYRAGTPVQGDVVVCLHPYVESCKLIKRVADKPVDAQDEGYWLLGDSATDSTDSRAFGPIRETRLIGKVAWRYWPLRRIGRIR